MIGKIEAFLAMVIWAFLDGEIVKIGKNSGEMVIKLSPLGSPQ